MEPIISAFFQVLDPMHLLFLWTGTLLGLIVGILPGLGGTAGLALIIPFMFGMEPSLALAMMIGLISPGTTSDTLPAVLMGIPGSSSAQATVMDGFPLAKKGEAARALGAAFSASLFGGLFGAVILTFAIFAAAPIILSIGFGEQWLLVILALTMVGLLTGANIYKGLASCCIGLMLGVVGTAPATAQERLTFGTLYLSDGLPIVVVGLALFAFPEIMDGFRRYHRITEEYKIGKGWLQGLRDVIKNKWLLMRCSFIGCVVGALPGLGSSVASWVAYGHAVQSAKDRSQFGKGDIRGVIAPESSNNAVDGGTLIPTLLLGIPGSGTMAIMLAGFVTVGVQPGVNLVVNNPDLTYVMVWSLALANIIGAGVCLALSGPISRMTMVPYAVLGPVMLVIIFFGAFQATRDWGDLIALCAIGILGCFLKRFGWSRPAVVIGFFLSQSLEQSTYRAIQVYGFSFFERPQAIFIVVLIGLALFTALRFKGERPALEGVGGVGATRSRMQQIVVTVLLLGLTGLVFYDGLKQQYLALIFPVGVAVLAFVLLIPVFVQQIAARSASTAFHDGDADLPANVPGLLHYLLWVAGLLIGTWLVGLPIAMIIFVFVFIRVKSDVSVKTAALVTAVLFCILSLASDILSLRYPENLLQRVIDFPTWMGG